MRLYAKLAAIICLACACQAAAHSPTGRDVWLGLRWNLACATRNAAQRANLFDEALRLHQATLYGPDAGPPTYAAADDAADDSDLADVDPAICQLTWAQ